MAKLETRDLSSLYGEFQALQGVSLAIEPHRITALIGPSGCGKSTLLRTFNRMNDLITGFRHTGAVLLDGQEIYSTSLDAITLRTRVGMVFQRPNPFPLSVFENVAFGIRVQKRLERAELARLVEAALRAVLLWDVLKDRLHQSALTISLEQQQRLCIARLLPVQPEILLMDEPCSALDPVATQHIEELMHALKTDYTIAIVTHNMQQASRIADDVGFMLLGDLVEFGPAAQVFTAPHDQRTEAYITGRFG